MPVTSRTTPAPGKSGVDKFEIFILSPVAKRRKIRYQADVPKQSRYGRICRDGKNVPYQRAAEIGPYAHRVWIREQPICGKPRTPCMQQRKHRGASNGKKRHCLGKTVDRRSPLLIQKQQNSRDQSSGVANTDHQTKLIMSNAQPTGWLLPQTPIPFASSHITEKSSS